MITAKILPYAFVLLFGIAVGSGATLSISKAIKPEIKLECPAPVVKCPDTTNSIDFDKIKNARNITVQQHYHVEMNGDSLVVKKIIAEMETKLKEIRLARCK